MLRHNFTNPSFQFKFVKIIPRAAAQTLQRLAKGFPILALTGRVGRVELLPLSARELARAGKRPATLGTLLFSGGYPALFDREISPADWFANYVASYLERDVRQLIAIRDLATFQRFVKLCAARSGQMLNLSALGADCGISAVTAREWLSVLEASYLVIRLQPYHRNFGKRLVKTPKLYFLDAGRPADFYFWRDNIGHEVDLVYETSDGLQAFEIKSGGTFASDWPASVQKWKRLAGAEALPPAIVYGGEGEFEREGCRVLGWQEFSDAFG